MDNDTATGAPGATYRTRCRHGYAGPTLDDVAAEARSTAAGQYGDGAGQDYVARCPGVEGWVAACDDVPREGRWPLAAAGVGTGGSDGPVGPAVAADCPVTTTGGGRTRVAGTRRVDGPTARYAGTRFVANEPPGATH